MVNMVVPQPRPTPPNPTSTPTQQPNNPPTHGHMRLHDVSFQCWWGLPVETRSDTQGFWVLVSGALVVVPPSSASALALGEGRGGRHMPKQCGSPWRTTHNHVRRLGPSPPTIGHITQATRVACITASEYATTDVVALRHAIAATDAQTAASGRGPHARHPTRILRLALSITPPPRTTRQRATTPTSHDPQTPPTHKPGRPPIHQPTGTFDYALLCPNASGRPMQIVRLVLMSPVVGVGVNCGLAAIFHTPGSI